MKRFESETKYRDKRYTVKSPWKLKKECLHVNQKIAEYRFSRRNQ